MVSNIIELLEFDALALEGSGENEDLSHICLLGKELAPKPLNRSAVITIIRNAWRTRCEFFDFTMDGQRISHPIH
ncbi:hypothetical protein ACSBR1_034799 [Camellia fascicularis]